MEEWSDSVCSDVSERLFSNSAVGTGRDSGNLKQNIGIPVRTLGSDGFTDGLNGVLTCIER